jgi:hypothetical protein
MEKTAVEYLIEQFESYDSYQIKLFHNEINTAKEMEKQQMCKFAYKCHNHYKVNGDFKIEQYYNQTFNK